MKQHHNRIWASAAGGLSSCSFRIAEGKPAASSVGEMHQKVLRLPSHGSISHRFLYRTAEHHTAYEVEVALPGKFFYTES